MPLDAEPTANGEWQLERGIAVRADMFAAARYRAHWASCSDPQRFRRKP
jgi:hypothetical protein